MKLGFDFLHFYILRLDGLIAIFNKNLLKLFIIGKDLKNKYAKNLKKKENHNHNRDLKHISGKTLIFLDNDGNDSAETTAKKTMPSPFPAYRAQEPIVFRISFYFLLMNHEI